MKLSEMTTEKALDSLCILSPYITNIVTDTELLAELRKAVDPNQVKTQAEKLAFGAEKLSALIPIVLKKHKTDLFEILGVLNDKTGEEIAKQSFLTTGLQIREAIKDKELISFFKSCVSSEGNE